MSSGVTHIVAEVESPVHKQVMMDIVFHTGVFNKEHLSLTMMSW